MKKCSASDKDRILDYIGKEYGRCLYLYVDLMKYGFDNPNVNLWIENSEEDIKVLILQYYTGMHVFSRSNDFDIEKVKGIIEERKPAMVCGMNDTLSCLGKLKDYESETGKVGHLLDVLKTPAAECIKANREDLREVADMMSEDEALGKPYKDDTLYEQLAERYDQGFGRTFIIRDDKNNEVIATASTYAEEAGVAVVSGVMVREDHRGEGLASKVLSALCSNLKSSGMDVYSYYYIEQAEKLHINVGFESIGRWTKLVRHAE